MTTNQYACLLLATAFTMTALLHLGYIKSGLALFAVFFPLYGLTIASSYR